MKGKVLVTGLTGFTGPYVREALETRGYEVLALQSEPASEGGVDLLDSSALDRYFTHSSMDYIIHLAGVSFVAHGRAADQYAINLIGSLNLLESVKRIGVPAKKIILASSANVYGRPRHVPVEETAVANPLSDYGVSKYAMELMARARFAELPVLIVRPFNYTGIGQRRDFIVPKLAATFMERGAEVEVGDTSVVREFMDVRDVAEIYVKLLECDAKADVVNICSGRGYRVCEVIDVFRQLSGHEARIVTNPAFLRRNEIPALVGSPDKLRSLIGPLSFRDLSETLDWMLHG